MSKKSLLACIILSSYINHSKAAIFCVNDSDGLRSALAVAGVNGQSDEIRLKLGTYQVSATQGFKYFEHPTENFVIDISGGWEDFLDYCNLQYTNDPYGTVLDGNNQFRVLEMVPNTNTDVKISHLSFINGFQTGPGSNSITHGGGLLIKSDNVILGNITIENNNFLNNHAFGGGAILVRGAETVIFRNNLITANTAESGLYAVNIQNNDQNGFYVTNNTIMFNSGGLYINATGSSQAFVANNLIWQNDGLDLAMYGNANQLFLHNNNFAFRAGTTPIASNQSANTSYEPIFEAGLLNFTPSIHSLLVGGGRNDPFTVPVPTPFEYLWTEGDFDFEGHVRNQGNRIDVGAVESPHQMYMENPIFEHGFEMVQ